MCNKFISLEKWTVYIHSFIPSGYRYLLALIFFFSPGNCLYFSHFLWTSENFDSGLSVVVTLPQNFTNSEVQLRFLLHNALQCAYHILYRRISEGLRLPEVELISYSK